MWGLPFVKINVSQLEWSPINLMLMNVSSTNVSREIWAWRHSVLTAPESLKWPQRDETSVWADRTWFPSLCHNMWRKLAFVMRPWNQGAELGMACATFQHKTKLSFAS
jgi:hypothetical protein